MASRSIPDANATAATALLTISNAAFPMPGSIARW